MKKLLFLCLLAFAPVTLASADIKVAVIDLGRTFDQYYVTKDARSTLNQKHDKFQKELQEMAAGYNHMGEDLKSLSKAADDPTLAPAAREEKQKAADQKRQEFAALTSRLQEKEKELDKTLNDEMMRRHKEILDQIVKVVSDYSGPQGYDLVIDKSSIIPTSGVSMILYNSSKLTDITGAIVDILNKSAPTTTTSTAPSSTPPAPVAAH